MASDPNTEAVPTATITTSPPPPPIEGVHHFKFHAHDLLKTVDFYTTVLRYTRIPEYDHRTPAPESKLFGVLLRHPATPLLEIRLHPGKASQQPGWDPIVFEVVGKMELEEWAAWFDAHGVKRSRVLKGFLGWTLCFEDPERRILRFYTRESHEWTTEVDRDDYWL